MAFLMNSLTWDHRLTLRPFFVLTGRPWDGPMRPLPLNEGADNFFQKYLYMGVYPMCPYPANDHSIQPDSLVDGYYAAYGPLLRLLQGRTWVLKPHVIFIDNDLAKVNLFETPDGYVVPVVYGKAAVVRVTINESAIKHHSGSAAIYKVWYPGNQEATVLRPIRKDAMTSLNIPLHRGCAMLSVSADLAERNQ